MKILEKNKKYFDIIFNKLNKFNNQKGGLNQQMSYNQQPPMQYNQPPPMQYNQLPPMQYNQPPMQYNQPPPMQYNQPPPMPFGPDSEQINETCIPPYDCEEGEIYSCETGECVGDGSFTFLDWVQLALDIAGFIPAAGIGIDLLNACVSMLRGETLEAVFSLINAAPIIGSFIGTPAKYLTKLSKLKKMKDNYDLAKELSPIRLPR